MSPTKLEPTSPATTAEPGQVLIRVRDLDVHYQLRGSSLARLLNLHTGSVRAVDRVSLDLHRGEVLGLVGESGSGKTTLGRALLGLVPATRGSIEYDGDNVTRMSERELRRLRRKLQMVFQDPNAALNPSMNIETAVGHPLKIHGLAAGDELRREVAGALERVGLSPVERFMSKYPSDLSGGQKQRAVIARAIILGPEMLVADEPVSMLDMSVRAKILQLMLDLKDNLGLTYVYITHDLASAKFFCDRVAIMYLGRIVEIGPTAEIFADPKHPYTSALLKAIPDPDPNRPIARDLPRGEIPDAANPPLGCAFHPRCPAAFDACGWESRDVKALIENSWTQLDPQAYEAERTVVVNLDELDRSSHVAVLKPGRGHDVADVAALVHRLKGQDPDEPLWRGVAGIDQDSAGVTIRFYAGEDPRLRPAGGVEVACHLHPDPGSLLPPR